MAQAAAPRLEVGARAEVHSGFDGTWQRGFVVAEITATGYLLRREVDGSVLPEIAHDRVRRERKRETWWF